MPEDVHGEGRRQKVEKQRLDLLLVQRGLVETREQARRLVMAGEVTVDGQVQDKPGQAVAVTAELFVRAPLRRCSRSRDSASAEVRRSSMRATGRA